MQSENETYLAMIFFLTYCWILFAMMTTNAQILSKITIKYDIIIYMIF